MPRYFLVGAKIEGFRGINNEGSPLVIKFKKDRLNSVFAMNGVGKSSLFDAIQYAITGTLPKLDNLHSIERSEDYYLNRFHTQSKGMVELLFQSDEATPQSHTIRVERLTDGTRNVTSPSGHSNPEELLASFNSSFALLDYHTFNTFISNSPLERGRSFSALLGLDIYSDFRQAIKSAADTRAINTDLGIAALQASAKLQNDNTTDAMVKAANAYKLMLGKDMGETSKLDEYSQEVLNSLRQVPLIEKELSVATLQEVDFEQIVKTIKLAEGGKDKDRFLELSRLIAQLDALGSASQDITNERGKIDASLAELFKLYEVTAGKERRRLYDAAEHLINSDGWHNSGQCPLCESMLDGPIEELITQQQGQYSQVDRKITEVKELWQQSEYRKRLSILEGSIGKDLPEDEKILRGIDAKLTVGNATQDDVDGLEKYYDRLETRLSRARETYSREREILGKKLPKSLVQLTEQVETARLFNEHVETYKASVAIYTKTKTSLDLRIRWRSFINNTDIEFAKAETELSRKKLLTIEADYKDMFAAVMNSNDVVPNLTRDETSEHLYVQLKEFRGQQDLSAKPLLSESYRNALAISVYLSAAMKHSGAPRFIVLDDISSSFDAGHELNLIDYICNNLQFGKNQNGIQFIILTHDDLMQNLFERLASSDEAYHQVIEGMPPYNLTMRAKNITQLRRNATIPLTAGQTEVGKFWVRPYLECVLMEIIRSLKVSVPLDFATQNRKRMVQSCLDAIKKDVQMHSDAGKIVLEQSQIDDLNNMHLPSLVANWVSHFETGGGTGVSPAVLLGVLDTIDSFADCFKYDYTDPITSQVTRKYYRSLSSR